MKRTQRRESAAQRRGVASVPSPPLPPPPPNLSEVPLALRLQARIIDGAWLFPIAAWLCGVWQVSGWAQLLALWATMPVSLLVEGLVLLAWQRTPGRWLAGIGLLARGRRPLSVRRLLRRAALLMTRGLGWGLPPLMWLRVREMQVRAEAGRPDPWDLFGGTQVVLVDPRGAQFDRAARATLVAAPLGFVAALLLVWRGWQASGAVTVSAPAASDPVDVIVAELNADAPRALTEGVRFESAARTADHAVVLRHTLLEVNRARWTGDDSALLEHRLQPDTLRLSCAPGQLRSVLLAGQSLVYDYLGADGFLLGRVVIRPEDCR